MLCKARRSVRFVTHADEPLVRKVRLDRRLAPIRVIEPNEVRIDPLKQIERLQVLDHSLAHPQPIDPGILAGVFVVCAVGVEQVDHWQAVAQAGLIVVGVVAGGDLDDAGAERRVNQERRRR